MSPLAIIAVCTPILSLIATGAALFVRMTVRNEIHSANTEQLKQINGTYVRSAGSDMTGAEIQRRFEQGRQDREELRESIHEVDVQVRETNAYAHASIHEVRNKLQTIQTLQEQLGRSLFHKEPPHASGESQ